MKMAGFSSPNSSSSTQSASIFSSSFPFPFSSSSSSVFSNPNSSSSTQSSSIFGSSSPSPFSSSSSSTVFSTISLIPSFSISAPPFPFEFGGSSTPASSPLFGMSITTTAPASPSSVSGLSSNLFGSFSSSAASTNTTSQSLCSPFCGSSSSNSSILSLDFCSSPFDASSSSSVSIKPFANSGSPFSGLPSASFLGSASPLKTQSESAFSFKIGAGSTSKPTSPAAGTSKPNSSPAAGVTNPNSVGSGTALNIFSAVTTHTSSTPAAAAAAASTISGTAASQAPPSASFPSFSTDLSGLSFSLSTESSATSQAQSTALLGTPFSIGVGIPDKEGRFGSEGEQVRDRVVEEPVVQIVQCEPKNEEVEGLRQDHEEYVILESAGVQQSVECGVLPSSSIVNEDVGTSAGSPNTKFATTDSGVAAPSKEIEVEPCENSSADSEVVSGDEIGIPGVASKISCASLCSDMNDFTPSSQNRLIVKQIITKYGDITTGSMLKSVAAKSAFLQLVADVVHRLCNHTLDTLGHDEMQLIQTRTADAVAVGFHVDWLQRRVNEVATAFKHQVCTIELEQLGEKIYAAKKSLAELELQQMVRKKEVTFLKAEMEGKDFNGPNLGDGLL